MRTTPQASTIVIAPMRKRHLRGVSRIEQEVNHRPWSASLFAGELRMPSSRHYVVALDGAVVVGFGGVMYTGHEAHVTNVACHPERRREQIATRMLLCLFADCRRREADGMTLEVRVTNEAAIALYQRFGFAPGGIRRNYYADIGEDALIMWAHDLGSEEMSDRLAAIRAELRSPLVTHGLHPEGALPCP